MRYQCQYCGSKVYPNWDSITYYCYECDTTLRPDEIEEIELVKVILRPQNAAQQTNGADAESKALLTGENS